MTTTVLHVVDADLARGAQRGAQMLRDALDAGDERTSHRLLTIFRSEPAALEPDLSLDVTDGLGRSIGLAPGAVAALRRSSDARSADVLVAHGGEALKYVVAAQLPGRIVYHKIGTLGRRFERAVSGRLHRWAVERADAVVAISSETRTEAIDVLGVDPNRVTTIPNGRDPSRFRPAPHRRPGPTRLAFVGHLTRTKRPDVFCDLVAALIDRSLPLEATIAGDGPHLDRVQARGSRLGIRVLGRHDDVPALLADTDVLVLTSVAEGEGMPGVLVEAAMSGVVPVTTDVPGARDIVLDGSTGAIVGVHDFDALVDTVADLVADPGRRWRIGAAARDRAVERFSAERVASQWAEVCRTVAGEVACAFST